MKDFRCEICYINIDDQINIISRFDVIDPKSILKSVEFRKTKVVSQKESIYYCPFENENNFKSHEPLLQSIAALEVIRGSYYSRYPLDRWFLFHNCDFYITFGELNEEEILFDQIQDGNIVHRPYIYNDTYSLRYMHLNKIIILHSNMIKHFYKVDGYNISVETSVETNRWIKNAPEHSISERILCALVAQRYKAMRNYLISIEKRKGEK